MSLKFETIEKLDRLLEVEKAWDELVTHSETDHAFMRHLWFSELAKAYSIGERLAIVAAYRDGLLVGLAPFYRSYRKIKRVRVNALRFIANEMTPRCNIIVADQETAEPLLRQVLALDRWDIAYLKNLEESLVTTRSISGFLSSGDHGCGSQTADGFQSPYLVTEGTFEEYWGALSKKRRRSLERYAVERLKEAGDSEIYRMESGSDWRELQSDIFRVSSKSWKGESGDNLSLETGEGRLYASYSPKAIDLGMASVYVLKIKGALAGFTYCLRCGNRYAGMRSDFDDEFKYFSPGNNLHLAVIRDMFSQGEPCEYDFGGDVHDYKMEWCRSIRRHITITVGNKTIRGKAIMAAKNVILPLWRKTLGKQPAPGSEPAANS